MSLQRAITSLSLVGWAAEDIATAELEQLTVAGRQARDDRLHSAAVAGTLGVSTDAAAADVDAVEQPTSAA